MPVKFQSDRRSITPNHAASRFLEFWRLDVRPLSEYRPWFRSCTNNIWHLSGKDHESVCLKKVWWYVPYITCWWWYYISTRQAFCYWLRWTSCTCTIRFFVQNVVNGTPIQLDPHAWNLSLIQTKIAAYIYKHPCFNKSIVLYVMITCVNVNIFMNSLAYNFSELARKDSSVPLALYYLYAVSCSTCMFMHFWQFYDTILFISVLLFAACTVYLIALRS